MNQKIKKAVIPAAGLGTRFLPVTKAVPKEMIPIIDKPMIHYIVEEAIESGFQDIILITAKNKDSIEHYFDYNNELEDRLMKSGKEELAKSIRKIAESCNIISVYQKDPLGLGHAVGCAESVVGEEYFAVLLGDDLIDAPVPCTKQLFDISKQYDSSVVGIMEVPESDVSKYGIVGGKNITPTTIRIDQMVEKPKAGQAPSRYAIPGRYVLHSDIFECIKNTKPGTGGEIQLTDALMQMAKNKGLLGHLFTGDRYDTGDRLGYLDATIKYGLKRPDIKDGLVKIMKKHLSALALFLGLTTFVAPASASNLPASYVVEKMVSDRALIKKVEITGKITDLSKQISFEETRQMDFITGQGVVYFQYENQTPQEQQSFRLADLRGITLAWLGLGMDSNPERVRTALVRLQVIPLENSMTRLEKMGKKLFWEWGDSHKIKIEKDQFWFTQYQDQLMDEVWVEEHSKEGGAFRLPKKIVFKKAGTALFMYELLRFRTNSFSRINLKNSMPLELAKDWADFVR